MRLCLISRERERVEDHCDNRIRDFDFQEKLKEFRYHIYLEFFWHETWQ